LKIRWSTSAESVTSNITSAANKSRDAKSCVSQERNTFVLSVFIASVYCHGLIGRRKILCLYWADAIKYIRKNQGYYMHSTKVETQDFASHKQGKHLFSAYSSHARYCQGLIGRRKILRLYWACAVERVMRGRKMRGAYRDAWIYSYSSKKSLQNKFSKQKLQRH